MVYLDNSATTRLYDEVYEEMLPFLLNEYGNPAGKYYKEAVNANEAVKNARERVSKLLGCSASEIVFTSGSTEANNMIIKGVAELPGNEGKRIITSAAEHPSILETCKYLETKGFDVVYLPTDSFGRVSVDDVKENISDDTILVTLIWGNNELGSLNDMKEISEICRKKNIKLHSDATQIVGKVDFTLADYPGITFLSCSAHKFHGPKGTGCAFIRKDAYGILSPIVPLLHGGGQEANFRSGTLAVHNIVGMGKAADMAAEHLQRNIRVLEENEAFLLSLLKEKFGGAVSFNNDAKDKIPGIVSVQFKGVNNELLLKQLAPYIAASTGSACSASKPSHVLKAAGYSLDEIRSTIRFSMSVFTTQEELEIFNEL